MYPSQISAVVYGNRIGGNQWKRRWRRRVYYAGLILNKSERRRERERERGKNGIDGVVTRANLSPLTLERRPSPAGPPKRRQGWGGATATNQGGPKSNFLRWKSNHRLDFWIGAVERADWNRKNRRKRRKKNAFIYIKSKEGERRQRRWEGGGWVGVVLRLVMAAWFAGNTWRGHGGRTSFCPPLASRGPPAKCVSLCRWARTAKDVLVTYAL